MRLLLTLFLFSLCTVAQSAEPSIQVLSPNGGEKIEERLTVKWKSNGIGDFVKIRAQGVLRKNGKRVGLFPVVEKTENDGEFTFDFPLNAGYDDFVIRVASLDGKVWDESDDVFTRPLAVARKIKAMRAAEAPKPIRNGDRVVFLGDSNTYSGKFIAYLHASCLLAEQKFRNNPEAPRDVEFLNLGLSSETASGLSEPDHPFPRPCVLDRIDRALELTKPDVVIVCYGINDAIYYPFEEERFTKFKEGMQQIFKKVHTAEARMILVTPPPFDALPLKESGKLRPKGVEKYAWFAPFENYDDVMSRYADWERGLTGTDVDFMVDLNRVTRAFLETRRRQNPKFTFAKDGVHLNDEGHQFVAKSLQGSLGLMPSGEVPDAMVDLVMKRQNILRDAWLTHVGHKRPGIKNGLPIEEAEAEAKKLMNQIKKDIAKLP